jgi:hypothetical protein
MHKIKSWHWFNKLKVLLENVVKTANMGQGPGTVTDIYFFISP